MRTDHRTDIEGLPRSPNSVSVDFIDKQITLARVSVLDCTILDDAQVNQSPRSKRRFSRQAIRIGAVSAATLLHLSIVLVVGLALERTDLQFQAVSGGGGAILASLTPATTLIAASANPTANALDGLARLVSDDPAVSSQQPGAQPGGSNVLAELDESRSSAAQTASTQTNASTQSGATNTAQPSLGTAENPWAHASATALNTSKVHEFWAAVKPCWRGEVDEGSASIRVVLDPHGKVQNMSAMTDVGQAKSAAEALATAVNACAPYQVGDAGAYLVTGPV